MSDVSITWTPHWQRKLDGLQAYDRRATPYIAEGMDRIFFSFRRDRIIPDAKRAFDRAGSLSRPSNSRRHGWKIGRSSGDQLRELIGRVFIPSKAAFAHEEGATVKPKAGSFMAIPVRGSKAVTPTGKLSATGKRLLARNESASERTFTRKLSGGSIGVFLESGKTKTGKFRKGARTELVFRLVPLARIRQKLNVHKMWEAYGPERERRLKEQLVMFYEDLFAGRRHRRERRRRA